MTFTDINLHCRITPLTGQDYEVTGQGHSDPKMECDTPPSQGASTHRTWDSYLI